MHAEAEGEVLVRLAPDVEAERVGVDVLVAVGRRVRQQHRRRRARSGGRASSYGVVQLRMKCLTGVTQRMISSTAVGISDGSSRSRCSWSGFSTRACSPPAIDDAVVSWPAVAMMT